MNSIRQISLAATLLAGCALAASPGLAQDQGFHPTDHPHAHPMAGPHAPAAPGFPHGPAAPGFHRGVPSGTYRVIRPGPGFHRGPGAVAHFHPFHAIIARHVPFARFSPAERALWAKGQWRHRWWHGRYGWWWYTGGAWFWYTAPVYPYPTVVSDYYYEDPDSEEAGPTWWYCYNPAGYYPYVPNCYVPWTPVPAQAPGYGEEQAGPEQGPPPGYDQGSEQGPPPGYDEGGPQGNEQGPPPGYDQGPQGYDQGPPPDDQGPPPNDNQYPQNSH